MGDSNNVLIEVESIDYDKTKFVKCLIDRIFYRASHIHRSLEIMLVLGGSCDLIVHGKTYSLVEGDIALVNCSTSHETKTSSEEGCVALFIQLSKPYLDLLEIRDVMFDDIIIKEDSPHHDSISALMLALARCYFLKDAYMYVNCATLSSRLLYYLLTNLVNHHVDRPAGKEKTKDKRVNEIVAYLDEHYTQKISVQTLADAMDLTPQYISKIFTQEMGMSIRDYITRARFAHALRLIDNSELPLIDVCYESGFSDYKYMEKSFVTMLGCTPREYRKRSGMIRQQKNTKEFIFSDSQAADYIGRVYHAIVAKNRMDDRLMRMYSELFGESISDSY